MIGKIMSGTDNVDAFKIDDFVVYPAHGVGKVVGIETQIVVG
jgi:RNA polymerase-interacting CarD/CdnL/TRCF family regulator